MPGLIPLDLKGLPATDLIVQGQLLGLEDAVSFRQSGGDLSLLEPQNSDLWSQDGTYALTVSDEVDIREGELVDYLSVVLSRTGNFRFSVKKGEGGRVQTFTILASKKSHGVLLRKALLEKLGYQVPAIKHLNKVTVRFSSTFERENFINDLAEGTFGDPKRWVIQQAVEGKEIVLQDVLVMEGEDLIYNLAMGQIPEQVIKGRRVLNALLLPYAVISPVESVNLFSFEVGRILSGSLKVDYEDGEDFSPSFEDAKWIARKIARLSRQDFEQIARSGLVPPPVEKILVEKFISRRNSLVRLLGLNEKALEFKADLTIGKELVKGKLTREWWDGHGERFSYGDPKAPLSGSEVFSYFKSEFISNALSNLMSSFNEYVIPHTDLQMGIAEHQAKTFDAAFQEFLKTGVYKEVPIGVFVLPVFDMDLMASRDIVAGTYLGTDNVVQLADSFGVSLELGAYIGVDGPTAPWMASGKVTGRVTRRYSHLRPIKSIKAALKSPYKNIIVPLYKRRLAKKLDALSAVRLAGLTDEELKVKITELMGDFYKDFEVGESLIITDSIGPSFNFGGGIGLAQSISAQARFFGSQMILSRLHIYRRDEKTVQVYRDFGNIGQLGISFGVQAFIPILTISAKVNKGVGRTKFYSLNLDPNPAQNKTILRNIQSLRALLFHNDMDLLEFYGKPFLIEHKIREGGVDLNFLLWRYKTLNTTDLISVTHPEGAKKYFYRQLSGHRSGRNPLAFTLDIANGLLNTYVGNQIALADVSNGNPGDSFMGKSKAREVNFEGEILNYDSESKTGEIREPFISISYLWKGWTISKKKVLKLIADINQDYNFPLYVPESLNTTKSIQLYSLFLNIYFYKKAIGELSRVDDKKLLGIYRHYAKARDRVTHGGGYIPGDPIGAGSYREVYTREEQIRDEISGLKRLQKKYNKWLKRREPAKLAKYGVKIAANLEEDLYFDGVAESVGGKQNLFVTSQLRGFRKGDENGDTPLLSHTLGEFGDRKFMGPLSDMKGQIGMTDAEFFAYWMMDKL
ncbi:MAG: hypothetical protein A2X86_15375 [Bdellovibrionales bacterium GWA2_49_15]|nr:MAG: hypothetical protein A2X86_15375 [Bdellovibrionales bacterium GWA2_49_15]